MIDHTRHIGIFNASELNVCLIGAGGIGAITAITLGKMGVNTIYLYDDDFVDDINLATQYHRVSDVGLRKVRTVYNSVYEFSRTNLVPLPQRVKPDSKLPVADIYISAVDSIASRQDIWRALRKLDPEHGWYIDARMGAEVYEHYIVKLEDYHWYQMSLAAQDDNDFPDLPCTSKATIYTANIAAGHIGAAIRRILTGKQKPGFLTHGIFNNTISFLDI